MSPVAILGQPAPLWDYVVSGPFPIRAAVWTSVDDFRNGYISGPWPARDVGGTQPRDLWVYNSFGAGAVQAQVHYKGIQCTASSSAGAGVMQDGLSGISLMPITDGSGLDPNYVTASWRRVNWFSWSMALDAGATPNLQSGVYFDKQANVPAVNRWPLAPAPAAGGGFGIFGDAAGGWQWATFSIGAAIPPLAIRETVSLAANVADPEDWNTFEIITISASGSRAASLELWINGQLVLTRAYGAAPLLEGLGTFAGADFFRYTPIVQVGPATGIVHFGDWTHRMGRFTRGGRELAT